MDVTAFNVPGDSLWRWRIVNYAGQTIAESEDRFPTIGAAVKGGAEAMRAMSVVDDSEPLKARRSTWHRRRQ